MNWSEIFAAGAPELLLVVWGLVAVLLGAWLQQGFSAGLTRLSVLVLFVAAILALLFPEGGTAFNGLYESDEYVNFAKAVAYICAAVSLLVAETYLTREKIIRFEYPILIVFASFGMGVMLSASDLMTLYLGIETLGLSSYVLAAFHRDNTRSSEAGLKYFVLGALASGLILYGASLVYGFSGETRFDAIAAAPFNMGILFGLVLLITGLAFKVSAAPLHVWTPDVYEGAPTPVVTFFATAPKIAAMVVFASFLFDVFGAVYDQWMLVLAIISAASMLIGAFGALNQDNIKRLLAYSSIGNMGFALIAVAAGEELGRSALLVYMTIYVLTTLGVFGVILALRRRTGNIEHVQDLSGLSQTNPWMATCLTALIFSVAGIPPLAGFFGKWVVFEAGLNADLLWLVIVGVIASVVSLGYYLRIIMVVWGGASSQSFERVSPELTLTVSVSALLSFPILVVLVGWLMRYADGTFAL